MTSGREPDRIRLAPDAAALVDDLTSSWRAELIAMAYKELLTRSPEDTDSDVTTAEIRMAAQKLDSTPRAGIPKVRRSVGNQIAIPVTILGSSILIGLGVNYLSTSGLDRADRVSSILSLSAGIFGLVAAAGALYLARAAARTAERAAMTAAAGATAAEMATILAVFTHEWNELERGIRVQAKAADGTLDVTSPFSAALRTYADAKKLDKREFAQLRGLVQLRNEIAHSRVGDEQLARIENAIPVLRKQLERLHKTS